MEMSPIYLRRLDERTTVLIGGDEEAEGKGHQLLERHAKTAEILGQKVVDNTHSHNH